MASLKELIVKIGADTKGLDDGITKAKGGIAGFSVSAGAAAAAASAAFAAVGAALVKVGTDWETATATIRNGTGATGAALDDLRESAANVFKGVPETIGNVANVIAVLNTQTSATGGSLETLTTKLINVSQLLGEDATANAEGFGKVLKQFGEDADSGAGSLDLLFLNSQKFAVGIGEQINLLSSYGSVLKNAGFSINQAADFMARLQGAGLDITRVMPGLNAAFRRFAEDGRAPVAALQETIDKMVAAGSESEALKLATQTFGAEGAQRMTTAIRSGLIPSLDELGIAAVSAQGLINQTTEESRTLGERFSILYNNVTTLIEPLGTRLVDALNSAVEWVMNLGSEFDAVVTGIGVFIDELAAGNEGFAGFIKGTQFAITILKTGFLVIIETVGKVLGWLADVAGGVWDFFKSKGEKATKDLEAATKNAATATDDYGKALQDAKADMGGAATSSASLTTATNTSKSSMEAAQKAAEDAAKAYADLDPKARAASLGVELFNLEVDSSPVKINGMAEATRKAAADLQAAHDSGQLAAPTIEWVGSASQDTTLKVQGLADAAFNVSTNVGLAKDATDEWLTTQNAANQKALEAAGALEDIGFEAGKLSKPTGEGSIPQVSTVITDLGEALFDTITGEGSFVQKAKGIMTEFGKAIFRDVVENGLKKVLGSLTDLLNFDFKSLKSKFSGLGNLFGGGGGGGGGFSLGGGGGDPITGAINAGSSIFGNFQMATMNKNIKLIEEQARRTAQFLGDRGDGGIIHAIFKTNELLGWGPLVKAAEAIKDALLDGVSVSGLTGTASGDYSAATASGVNQAAPNVGQETASAFAREASGPIMEAIHEGIHSAISVGTPGRSRTGQAGQGGGMEMEQPTSPGGIPSRSRTGNLQSDPVYQAATDLFARNPLAVAAAQTGNVLASLVTGGHFLPEVTQAAEDTTTEVQNATTAIRETGTNTETRLSDIHNAIVSWITSARDIANRPIIIEIDGQEIARVVGAEQEALRATA